MKNTLIIKRLIALLLIVAMGFSIVGCKKKKTENPDTNGGGEIGDQTKPDDGANGGNSDGGNGGNSDGGNNSTGEGTGDGICEVEGADKTLGLFSGDVVEITISDYVDTNGLDKISYKVSSGKDVLILGAVSDGKFTVTAGDVNAVTSATVSITVCYDGTEKLTVDLTVTVVEKGGYMPDDNIDTDW